MLRRKIIAALLLVGLLFATSANPAFAVSYALCNNTQHWIPPNSGYLSTVGYAETPHGYGSSNNGKVVVAGRGSDDGIWATTLTTYGETTGAFASVWWPLGGTTYYAPIVSGGVKADGTTATTILVIGTDGYNYSSTDQNGTGWGNWTNVGPTTSFWNDRTNYMRSVYTGLYYRFEHPFNAPYYDCHA